MQPLIKSSVPSLKGGAVVDLQCIFFICTVFVSQMELNVMQKATFFSSDPVGSGVLKISFYLLPVSHISFNKERCSWV